MTSFIAKLQQGWWRSFSQTSLILGGWRLSSQFYYTISKGELLYRKSQSERDEAENYTDFWEFGFLITLHKTLPENQHCISQHRLR